MKVDTTGPASTSTVENVDDVALRHAQDMLGTSTPQDTVNTALREAARREVVARYLDLRKRLAESELERSAGWR